jgi:hypothetical protein
MNNTHRSFSEDFKTLWEKDSPIYKEWEKLEMLYSVLENITHNLALRFTEFRNITEIEKDMNTGKHPMENLFLETLLFWWNRILLRSCLKVRDALQLLFYSSNTANSYGCALAARSIIEHVALLQFLAQAIPWKNTQRVEKQALIEFTKRIYNLTQGSTFDWDKLLSGKLSIRKLLATKSWKRPKNERIPHISDLVDALDKEISSHQSPDAEGRIQFLYSALCDVVHPSWGGDFVYAPQMYRIMKAEQIFDEHFKKTATLFCLPMIEVVKYFVELIEIMINNEPRIIFSMPEN